MMRPGSSVAVVGSGISGLAAAHVLGRVHRVTLYEADGRLGGHAHTHLVGEDQIALDSGFMVYNPANYPLLTRMFDELGVRTRGSEMSMSVRCDGCGLHYVAGSPLRSAPQRPIAGYNPEWERALGEINRFNLHVTSVRTELSGHTSLGEMLEIGRYSPYFVRHFVVPLVSAVWSCGPVQALRYPAAHLFAFLDNHGLLRDSKASRWRTVVGGSVEYVRRIEARIADVRLSTRVASVAETSDGVEVSDERGRVEKFAATVIATHPLDAAKLCAASAPRKHAALKAIEYVPADVALHTDARVLPQEPEGQASWNYRQRRCEPTDGEASISYHLNRLQGIAGQTQYVVTLNDSESIAPGSMLARMKYEHPLYSETSRRAAKELAELSSGRLVHAGAYQGWGFHEDGCRSGVEAARALGVEW